MRKFLLCRVCQKDLTDTKMKFAFCCEEHRKEWRRNYRKAYYQVHREKLLKKNKEWVANNLERRREQTRRAQAKYLAKKRAEKLLSPVPPSSSEGGA